MSSDGEMMDSINILDVVALTEDLPEESLRKGQVGTVVELLAPGVFEVEFSDDDGRTFGDRTERRDATVGRRVAQAAG